MKLFARLFLVAALAFAALPARAQTNSDAEKPPPSSLTDATSRFIFYSVLEGLYEDGLSNADVDRILLQTPDHAYIHFIYACPVCLATIQALQAYRARPEHLYSLKSGASAWGDGLPATVRAELASDDTRRRLAAINQLMQNWLTRRLQSLHLPEKERAALLDSLAAKRQAGMDVLEEFRRNEHGPDGIKNCAPAYADLTECAVCNGVVGKPMKLPEAAPK